MKTLKMSKYISHSMNAFFFTSFLMENISPNIQKKIILENMLFSHYQLGSEMFTLKSISSTSFYSPLLSASLYGGGKSFDFMVNKHMLVLAIHLLPLGKFGFSLGKLLTQSTTQRCFMLKLLASKEGKEESEWEIIINKWYA